MDPKSGKFVRNGKSPTYTHFLPFQADTFPSGIRLYYLPPYSPDLNPIEESFAYLKAYLQHHGPAFQHAVDTKDQGALLMFLHSTLATISPAHCEGWMTHSRYL